MFQYRASSFLGKERSRGLFIPITRVSEIAVCRVWNWVMAGTRVSLVLDCQHGRCTTCCVFPRHYFNGLASRIIIERLEVILARGRWQCHAHRSFTVDLEKSSGLSWHTSPLKPVHQPLMNPIALPNTMQDPSSYVGSADPDRN